MAEDDELDKQFGWFHQFADLPREQLIAEATADNCASLSALIESCLSDKPTLDTLSPDGFADYVLGLRVNERQWNQALCNALIRAEELSQSEGKVAAASALRSFAESCPWYQFRDVALNQAASYVPRH